jgi:hypothetical protein
LLSPKPSVVVGRMPRNSAERRLFSAATQRHGEANLVWRWVEPPHSSAKSEREAALAGARIADLRLWTVKAAR